MVSNSHNVQDLLTNSDLIHFFTIPNHEGSEDWETWKETDSRNQDTFNNAESMIRNFYELLPWHDQEDEFKKFMDKVKQNSAGE